MKLFYSEWTHISSAQTWAEQNMTKLSSAAKLCNYSIAPFCLVLRLHPQKQIEWLETFLQASRLLEDKEGESIHFGNLGLAYANQGDVYKAIQFHQRALVIDRETGDRRGEGVSLGNLVGAYYAFGDPLRAIQFYEQALVIACEIGDRRGKAVGSWNFGIACKNSAKLKKPVQPSKHTSTTSAKW